MNERRTESERLSEFERGAKQAFDASVRELDAATRQRLVQARERALANAGGARFGLKWSWSLAPRASSSGASSRCDRPGSTRAPAARLSPT